MVLEMKHANRQMDIMSQCLFHALFAKNTHTHTQQNTLKKTEHPLILNCQQESDFHKMQSNSTF